MLGGDALQMARKKLDDVRANLDAYESVTLGTNFPGAETGSIGG